MAATVPVERAEFYAAVVAATADAPHPVPLSGEHRQTVRERIRSYLKYYGYRLHSRHEDGTLWCWAERTR